jgi:hypothetical protein
LLLNLIILYQQHYTMIPGSNYIFPCTNCTNIFVKGSIDSGNNFGLKVYSDGKNVAPMMPRFPKMVKCKQCGTFVRLMYSKSIGDYEYHEPIKEEWKNAQHAEFLTIEENFEALESDFAKQLKRKEFILRQQIWWAYNERLKDGKELFADDKDQERYLDNIRSLKPLLDITDINQKIMFAEMHRNLGEFEDCISVLNTINDSQLAEIIQKLITACNEKHRWVFQLN